MAGERVIISATLAVTLVSALPNQEQTLIKVDFNQSEIQPQKSEEVVIITTSVGKIVVMLFDKVAPLHAANFKDLAKRKFYDGIRFHRCMPGFMIQGGDPNSKNLSQPDTWGYGSATDKDGNRTNVKAEFSELKHVRGVLSMARSADPNSASSQFFIMHADYPSLNSNYSAFGKVVSGIEVVDTIAQTGPADRGMNGKVPSEKAVVVESMKVAEWPLSQ